LPNTFRHLRSAVHHVVGARLERGRFIRGPTDRRNHQGASAARELHGTNTNRAGASLHKQRKTLSTQLVFTDMTGPNNVDVHNFYYLPPSLYSLISFFVLFQNSAG
jgi:hypothetical protein